MSDSNETVDHPAHYGGADNPYEAIKVIEAWGLGFCLGNAVKYICRQGKKENSTTDLKKALWYLKREIERREVPACGVLFISNNADVIYGPNAPRHPCALPTGHTGEHARKLIDDRRT